MIAEPEFRDLLRDLCVGVATLAAGTVHLVGVRRANEVVDACGNLCRWLDEQDALAVMEGEHDQ